MGGIVYDGGAFAYLGKTDKPCERCGAPKAMHVKEGDEHGDGAVRDLCPECVIYLSQRARFYERLDF